MAPFESDTDASETSDPRLDERYLRRVADGDGLGSVVLIGVVHDHPASLVRVARVLRSIDVDSLALELPPLAVPLFERYAEEKPFPPRLGGEMSLALGAFDGPAVGMDAPTVGYAVRLLRRLTDEDVSLTTARAVCRDLVSSGLQAVACRLGGTIAAHTPFTPRVYTPVEHETTLLEMPAEQAADERDHLVRRQSLLAAIKKPDEIRIVDELREELMAETLHGMRIGGDVVAVLGMEHLDPVLDELRALASEPEAAPTGDR